MPVLFDTTRHRVVFPFDGSDVTHPNHLTSGRVGEDDLVGNLLFGVVRILNVDGYLLIIVADAATHRGDTLRLQTGKEHLLSDAVGLEPLTIDIKTNLLFLFTKQFHVGDRGDAPQTVAQVVAVLFQFPVTALATLDGNQQGGGVAEVIVDHDGEDTCGQLRLESIQSVLNLAPHLILIVHIVIQFHHRDTHAVLRGGGGLGAVHLTKGEEVTLQRTRCLQFHFFRGSTWIDGHHHTLTDGGMGELILRHGVHPEDTHHKQDGDDEQCYRVIFQWPFQPFHLISHSHYSLFTIH